MSSQSGEEGKPIRWHAATLRSDCRHFAAHTDIMAMANAAATAPHEGGLDLRADCQAVVSGFANLEFVADDYKNNYAGILRVARFALEENGCRTRARKFKAHRERADVAEEG